MSRETVQAADIPPQQSNSRKVAETVAKTIDVQAPEVEATSAIAVLEPPVLKGEVITPQEELAKHEKVIRTGWKVAQRKAAEVYESLTFIYRRDLWKLHKVGGKRQYKSFQDYLFAEFGWTMSSARAHQIIREYDKVLIEKGVLDENEIPAPRNRTAPVISAATCAKRTADQIQTVVDAFENRLDNTEEGPNKSRLTEVYADFTDMVREVIVSLNDIREKDMEESETAPNGDTPEEKEEDTEDEEDTDDKAEE